MTADDDSRFADEAVIESKFLLHHLQVSTSRVFWRRCLFSDYSSRRHCDEIKMPPAARKIPRAVQIRVGSDMPQQGSALLLIRNQETTMSLLHQTDVYRNPANTDRKHYGYGAILVLICVALAILVASAVFAPIPVGNGIDSQSWFVGP